MGDAPEGRVFGPYCLVRPLDPGRRARRWLALHRQANTSHLLYEFDGRRDRSEQRRFIDAVSPLSTFLHPHLLTVREFSFGPGSIPWIVTDYPGNQDGLLTLEQLLEDKGGCMSASEAERAVTQLLDGLGFAHGRNLHHGPLTMSEVLVDRHGSLSVELFGLRRRLEGLSIGDAELVRDEVRNIVEIAYRLVTGLPAQDPRIPAGRLVRRLSREWDQFLEAGLDPAGGYDSAESALTALPSMHRDSQGNGRAVRVVLGRVRSAMRTQ